ncbi:MAG: insulinase family protein [Candidatus Synoicihabitans palmerolidicus]|nr:insulinase family protein [Candidatus Synoicihabitans palmerolidicus]
MNGLVRPCDSVSYSPAPPPPSKRISSSGSHEVCLQDALEPAANDAAIAGVTYTLNTNLEGLTLTVSGFGDSPSRFAQYLAAQLHTVAVSPARFAALSESVVRELRSFKQTEAYLLSSSRLRTLQREFYYLPDHSLDRAPSVTWNEIQASVTRFLASGKIEAIVHGHLTADQAVRAVADAIRAEPLPSSALLYRRQLTLQPGSPVLDVAVNSAYRAYYELPTDSPATRAAAQVIGNFSRTPYFDELRTTQPLGYIVGSGSASAAHRYLLYFVIQSSAFPVDELRARSETFAATLPDKLATSPPMSGPPSSPELAPNSKRSRPASPRKPGVCSPSPTTSTKTGTAPLPPWRPWIRSRRQMRWKPCAPPSIPPPLRRSSPSPLAKSTPPVLRRPPSPIALRGKPLAV